MCVVVDGCVDTHEVEDRICAAFPGALANRRERRVINTCQGLVGPEFEGAASDAGM
ncbi:hypothetical protein [Rhodococcus sp. IEGM 1379]|uniref:hypothetical protein n=1 Tax=Rhodococcus sp. IEGM 1379 TaxID=3047086 RepID=UPI0024B8101A|nr:hypothetical protein [Rhodococcus sp. IEGM 1379]MDI9915667.1 hypothetical protein [Rhodococcus sp. IEGM 1379]